MASIEAIKKLRGETNAGISDCREALDKHKGDLTKAKAYLKEKGVAKAAKRADRETAEGVVEVYLHPATNKLAAIVELQSETDFVARNEKFRDFAKNLAMQVAGMSPKYISKEDVPAKEKKNIKEVCLLEQPSFKDPEKTIGEMLTDLIAVIGENMRIAKFVRFEMGKKVVVAESKEKK